MSRKQSLQKLLQCVELEDLTRVSGDTIYKAFASHRQSAFVATFNGSLDTFVALLKSDLPGWELTYLGQQENRWLIALARLEPPTRVEGNHQHNPARAGLCAVLKALIVECKP